MDKTNPPQWLGLNESKVGRRGFLRGGAAAVGTGVGTFGMVRDNWVFDFKGTSAQAATGDEQTLPIRLTPMTATCRVPPLSE